MQNTKVLLFDLGGVIVRWVGLDALGDMLGVNRDVISARFSASPIFYDYERGHCGNDVFAEFLIAEFNLTLSLSEAKDLWNSWVQESYAGTKDMLTALRKDYVIACLSNTNSLHWGHLTTHINVDEHFDHSFASHLISAAKPDPESYQIAIQNLGVTPSDICFFDDTMVNVQAAKSIGMQAYHVDREVGVIPKLQDLGLIS